MAFGWGRRHRDRVEPTDSPADDGHKVWDDDGSPGAHWQQMIDERGWGVVVVEPDEGDPWFAFTAGLTPRELPELVVYGLAPDHAQMALDLVAGQLVAGTKIADGEHIPGVLTEGFRVSLWTATTTREALGIAFGLYGEENVRVRQLVIPDVDGVLPWEAGFDRPHLQPLLFEPINTA